jgi:hypothetical protein
MIFFKPFFLTIKPPGPLIPTQTSSEYNSNLQIYFSSKLLFLVLSKYADCNTYRKQAQKPRRRVDSGFNCSPILHFLVAFPCQNCKLLKKTFTVPMVGFFGALTKFVK